ncbi:MAG TPA: pilus assembly protein CpaE [Candidatus Avipropionibacterium avicola]|uniref:Pilus assembly protein CpaE n=1 Tax=Candidatus Avipropionibacterium avicola TaxID=2840701 RepID=A0A9D1KP81_9ACTN|nr:pilus assembly protein CpaE [Candidatus Avipropionibacterium avicola]
MITATLARALQQAGLSWQPANGDRFVIAKPEMGDEVFHLADMTVEAHDLDTGIILAFNGTTEWALDSVAVEHTVWLPREAQLRDALGDRFVSLVRHDHHHAVRIVGPDGAVVEVTDPDAECAYARALLRVLG